MRFNRNIAAPRALIGLGLIAAAIAGCGGGGSGAISPTPVPTASGTATPPVWPSPVAFDVRTVTNLAPVTTLPNGGGFAGTLTTQALLLKYTQLTAILTGTTPGVSPLAAARRAQDVLPNQTLAYIGLNFTLAVPSAPMTLTLQIPQNAVVAGASYYLALWDPQRPSLGWQHDFAGPVQVNTSTGAPKLSFNATPPIFNRYQQYWLAIYMLPSGAPRPTAAPFIAPAVTPAPSPTTFEDIQLLMSKANSCSGTPCATGNIPSPQPTQDYDVFPNQAVPVVMAGAKGSTKLTIRPHDNQAGDVLYFTPSLSDELALATDFTWDFYVMPDQPVWVGDPLTGHALSMAALEFDFNDASPGEPGFDYNLSSQCLLRDPKFGGPEWQIWGQKGTSTGWIDSGITCDAGNVFQAYQWTHIIWKYRLHPDTLQTEYVSLTIVYTDPNTGAPVTKSYTPYPAINPVQEVKKQARPTIEVQFQQDARPMPSPSPFTEWVDNVTLTGR